MQDERILANRSQRRVSARKASQQQESSPDAGKLPSIGSTGKRASALEVRESKKKMAETIGVLNLSQYQADDIMNQGDGTTPKYAPSSSSHRDLISADPNARVDADPLSAQPASQTVSNANVKLQPINFHPQKDGAGSSRPMSGDAMSQQSAQYMSGRRDSRTRMSGSDYRRSQTGRDEPKSGASRGSRGGPLRASQEVRASQDKIKKKKSRNPWEKFDVTEFKSKNIDPGAIISRLRVLTRNPLPFMGELPADDSLVSMDPLDSLMVAITKVINDRTLDFSDDVRSNIHLATGMRTEFCEQILAFIAHHQKLEQGFAYCVDFFMDSLEQLVHLRTENKRMNDQIEKLLAIKEDGILDKYGLQRHLEAECRRYDEVSAREQAAKLKIEQLETIMKAKNAECHSLQHRLNYFHEQALVSAAQAQQQSKSGTSEGKGAVPNMDLSPMQSNEFAGALASPEDAATEQALVSPVPISPPIPGAQIPQDVANLAPQASLASFQRSMADMQRLRETQAENERLQEEVNTLRQTLASKNDALHLRKMQELFNKLQIENKNLRIHNQKCETRLASKQSLIEHLEEKVHRVNVDKEEIIIRLKSEVDLLTRQHENAEAEFAERLKRERTNVEAKLQLEYGDQVKSLESDRFEMAKEREDLRERLDKLNQEHQELQDEFEAFRAEKAGQEGARNVQYDELEKRMTSLQQTHDNKETGLAARIEDLENKVETTQKDNSILQLRQKYLSQSTQTLVKQKVFLFETVAKGRDELRGHIDRMQEAMLASNNRQEYLVTVKRCIREAQTISDMGQNMLVNIMQILSFLKIEKLHQLLSSEAEMEAISYTVSQEINRESVGPSGEAQPSILNQMAAGFANVKRSHDLESKAPVDEATIGRFLNQIGAEDQTPDVSPEKFVALPAVDAVPMAAFRVVRELMHAVGIDADDSGEVLHELTRAYGHEPDTDDKAYSKYFVAARGLFEAACQKRGEQVQEAQRASTREKRPEPGTEKVEKSRSATPELTERLKEHAVEMETLHNKLEQSRLQSQNLQLNLAGKIIALEEQLEKVQLEHEEQIRVMEIAQSEEVQRVTQGVQQTEKQFLQVFEEQREEIRDLTIKIEQQWRPEENAETLKKMEQGTKGNLYQMMKQEYEASFKENKERLDNYQLTINEFVYLREDLRGSFTLAFEVEKLQKAGLLKILNEDMLRYYLSKTFCIDKKKFRFLRTEELYETIKRDGCPDKKAKILRLIIEVIAEDQSRVQHLFKTVKGQIRDGTSLLYDFDPLYFGMNLGSSGFSTQHNLNLFQLLSKMGQCIDGVEYVVSVLRHQLKPLIFKVIALNLELREEFMVELSETDIYEIVEGEQQILKSLEPDRLIEKITTNLNIIVRDKIKVLTCDQKIFFNDLWIKNMESHKHAQVHRETPREAKWPVKTEGGESLPSLLRYDEDSQVNLRSKRGKDTEPMYASFQSRIANTAARTSQLSQLREKNPPLPREFVSKFNTDVGCNTDFVISDLYEGFENVYRGVQNLGEETKMRLSILESTKTKTLLVTFDDLNTLKKMKFSLYQKQDEPDQYVIHIECMKIADGHHIMVSVEQIQQQCLVIRMYDLQICECVMFSLIRKQQGHFTRLTDDSQLDLMMKQDFRHMIYRLSFLAASPEESTHVLNGYQYLFEAEKAKRYSRAAQLEKQKKREEDEQKRESLVQRLGSKALPRRKRALAAVKFPSFSIKAFKKDRFSQIEAYMAELRKGSKDQLSDTAATAVSEPATDRTVEADWRDRQTDRGSLLYRQVQWIRCDFNEAMGAYQAVISMYLSDDTIYVEVVLYKEPSQVSIASEVPAAELFAGESPHAFSFKDRVERLDQMLEKFYIVSVDGTCHMKVEVDAQPIGEFLREREAEEARKKTKERDDLKDAMMATQLQQTALEEKERLIEEGEAKSYHRICLIDNEKVGVDITFLNKKKDKDTRTEKTGHGGRRAKVTSTYGKTQPEIREAKIADIIEGSCPWDQILFEIVGGAQDRVSSLFTAKKLAAQLSKDPYFEREKLLTETDPLFLDYLQESLNVEKKNGEVYIENTANVQRNVLQHYKMGMGGTHIDRGDNGLSADEQEQLRMQILCNDEIQFCQQLYDIKVFELSLRNSRDLIAYRIEIFAVSEPSELYVYNYPLNFSPKIQDPHTLVLDIFNLIESPLKEWAQKGNARKKKSKFPTDVGGNAGQAQEDTPTAEVEPADKALFRKYLDNRLILIIQEQRFPRKLDCMVVEPCSQLLWRQTFEPRVITLQGMPIAGMHLVDQGTLEMMVAIVMDEVENDQNEKGKYFEYPLEGEEPQVLSQTAKFDDIRETSDAACLVDGQVILEDELAITLFKHKEALNVIIYKPTETKISYEDLRKRVGAVDIKVDKPEPAPKDEASEDGVILYMRFSAHKHDYMVSKVIKLSGLNYVLLYANIQATKSDIKVVHLDVNCLRTLFKFTQINEDPDDSDDEEQRAIQAGKRPIFTGSDIQRSMMDSFRRYYGSQAMEQSLRLCDKQRERIRQANDVDHEPPTIFERMPEDPTSIHATRLLQKYKQSLAERCLVFHRKPIFDAEREKLLILQIRLKAPSELVRDDLTLAEIPEGFNVLITEPDAGQQIEFVTALDACLTQEELSGNLGDLKDLKILRKHAKAILEDRVEIQRGVEGQGQPGSGGILDNYAIAINLDRALDLQSHPSVSERIDANGSDPEQVQRQMTDPTSGPSPHHQSVILEAASHEEDLDNERNKSQKRSISGTSVSNVSKK